MIPCSYLPTPLCQHLLFKTRRHRVGVYGATYVPTLVPFPTLGFVQGFHRERLVRTILLTPETELCLLLRRTLYVIISTCCVTPLFQDLPWSMISQSYGRLAPPAGALNQCLRTRRPTTTRRSRWSQTQKNNCSQYGQSILRRCPCPGKYGNYLRWRQPWNGAVPK